MGVKEQLDDLKPKLPLLTLVCIFIVMIFLLVFTYRQYTDTLDKVDLNSQELDTLNNKINNLNFSKTLLKKTDDDMNLLLTRLIPEYEDFFSLINTMEKISQSSRFFISKYRINPNQGGKISITTEGTGDLESFVRFLQTYQFGGGRLITINNIQYSQSSSVSKSLTLNFYSTKTVINDSMPVELTKKDIDYLEKIKMKVGEAYEEDATDSGEIMDYVNNPNPF